jgi:hypothetical protein
MGVIMGQVKNRGQSGNRIVDEPKKLVAVI